MAVPSPPAPELGHRTARLHGLDLLRAVASLAVLYVHLSAWFRLHGGPTSLTTALDRWVAGPAQFNQDFGFFGVALFFLISGFVISAVGMRESVGQFALKRTIRIFPPLMAAVLLAWVLVAIGRLRVPGGDGGVGITDLLLNSVLANFFVPGHAALVGVAWTLVIQLGIYAMVCALLPLYRREPWLVIGIEITVCAIVLAVVRNFQGLPNSTLANVGAFGTAVVLGQVVWAVWTRRLRLWAGAGLGLGCWVVFLWGDALGYGRRDDSYPLTLCVALLIMITLVLAEQHVRPHPVVSWLSSRSYCTYLLHQTVLFAVLTATAGWSRWPAVLLALGCTFVAVELLHRGVERPAGRVTSALLGRRQDPPERPPGESPSAAPAASGAPG